MKLQVEVHHIVDLNDFLRKLNNLQHVDGTICETAINGIKIDHFEDLNYFMRIEVKQLTTCRWSSW